MTRGKTLPEQRDPILCRPRVRSGLQRARRRGESAHPAAPPTEVSRGQGGARGQVEASGRWVETVRANQRRLRVEEGGRALSVRRARWGARVLEFGGR